MDARSDIYSLGVSLYEMVTGMLPFEANSNYSLMAAHVEQIPKAPIVHKPGLPESLNQIILMALAKDPAKRFQSADAFRGALNTVDVAALKPAPAGTTMPSTWKPPYEGSGTDETMTVNTPAPARSTAARTGATGGASAAGYATGLAECAGNGWRCAAIHRRSQQQARFVHGAWRAGSCRSFVRGGILFAAQIKDSCGRG